ncbi:MAG: SEC-C domain-containing protein [Lachnospiraceae bacterium]|nr:SEC-C domain-containing protein [Lachnospiraceae bacterium]
MALLQEWQAVAYNEQTDKGRLQKFWQNYFLVEKSVYEKLLDHPEEEITGTVKELADRFGITLLDMTGFLDGINDSLENANPIDTMEEDTVVNLIFDKERLYRNMIDAKADWLYDLPQWDTILGTERKQELYLEQKKAGTVVKEDKIYPNDPCPCGSGKKYKKCCGKNK